MATSSSPRLLDRLPTTPIVPAYQPGYRADGNRNARICSHGPELRDATGGRLPASPSRADSVAGVRQAPGRLRAYKL